jgi:P27 family predicted phage terminase small subunit
LSSKEEGFSEQMTDLQKQSTPLVELTAHLSERARAVWDFAFPRLSALGILNELDIPKIIRYCETLVLWQECAAFLSKNGSVYPMKGRGGQLICMMPWPHAKMLITYGRALDGMEKELGMSPATRASFAALFNELKFKDSTTADPFSDYED